MQRRHTGGLTLLALAAILTLSCAETAPPDPDPEAEAVVRVVHDLFDGMRSKDTTKLRGVFAPGATLGSAGADNVQYSTAESFVMTIGQATADLDERIWDWEVRIDGNLATLWTKYDILINGEFSHCGVDAFHLHKSSDGWKIFHLADSRRRDPGCWRLPES